MSKRGVIGLIGLVCFLVGMIIGQRVEYAQAQESGKGPKWSHGLDLKSRPAGESSWDKARKFGIEVFRDENNGNWIYITQDGHIAVVPAK
jgi:hypothetical protein